MKRWLETLRKACRMMNGNPNGDIEQAYFWLTCKQRPESVSNSEFAHLATDEANGWFVGLTVQVLPSGKRLEHVTLDVYPRRDESAETFAAKADKWLVELETMREALV